MRDEVSQSYLFFFFLLQNDVFRQGGYNTQAYKILAHLDNRTGYILQFKGTPALVIRHIAATEVCVNWDYH